MCSRGCQWGSNMRRGEQPDAAPLLQVQQTQPVENATNHCLPLSETILSLRLMLSKRDCSSACSVLLLSFCCCCTCCCCCCCERRPSIPRLQHACSCQQFQRSHSRHRERRTSLARPSALRPLRVLRCPTWCGANGDAWHCSGSCCWYGTGSSAE
jgi:hypothetical protein